MTKLENCSICFHYNFSHPPLDDLEAGCDCDCHGSIFEDDDEEVIS